MHKSFHPLTAIGTGWERNETTSSIDRASLQAERPRSRANLARRSAAQQASPERGLNPRLHRGAWHAPGSRNYMASWMCSQPQPSNARHMFHNSGSSSHGGARMDEEPIAGRSHPRTGRRSSLWRQANRKADARSKDSADRSRGPPTSWTLGQAPCGMAWKETRKTDANALASKRRSLGGGGSN